MLRRIMLYFYNELEMENIINLQILLVMEKSFYLLKPKVACPFYLQIVFVLSYLIVLHGVNNVIICFYFLNQICWTCRTEKNYF